MGAGHAEWFRNIYSAIHGLFVYDEHRMFTGRCSEQSSKDHRRRRFRMILIYGLILPVDEPIGRTIYVSNKFECLRNAVQLDSLDVQWKPEDIQIREINTGPSRRIVKR